MFNRRFAAGLLILSAPLLAAAPATTSASRPTTHATPFVDLYLDALQKLRDAHEPIDPADLKVWPTLTDERNAAKVIVEIKAVLPSGGYAEAALNALDYGPTLPLSADERKALDDYLGGSADAIALLPKLVAATGYDWGEAPTGKLLDRATKGPLNAMRATTNLLMYRALLDSTEGRHRDAFAALASIHAAADGAANFGGLISLLVATGCDAQAADLARQIAWDLKVGDNADEVPRGEVEAQLVSFFDRRASAARFAQGFRSDRVFVIDSLKQLPQNADGSPTLMVAMNGLKIVDYFNARIAERVETGAAAIDAAKKRVAAIEKEMNNPPILLRLTAILLPSLRAIDRTEHRLDRDRHFAAAALAVRLYRLDHARSLPPTLEALVPKYLPAVPTDPDHGDEPFRYDPQRKILWTVGENGRDDHGAIGDETLSENERRRTTDAVYFLDPADRPKWLR